jgi:hypothetical protein
VDRALRGVRVSLSSHIGNAIDYFNVRNLVSHPYKAGDKYIYFCILMFIFFGYMVKRMSKNVKFEYIKL